jgi:hypothetical protein
MQPFRQFQQCRSIPARRSGKHYRKARHEEGRAQFGPARCVGLVFGTQIRKTLFQVPIHLGRKVAVWASTGIPRRLYVHLRTDGVRKRVERCEITGITTPQPGKAFFAQAGASCPGSVGETQAAGVAGKCDEEIFERC